MILNTDILCRSILNAYLNTFTRVRFKLLFNDLKLHVIEPMIRKMNSEEITYL